MKLLLVFALVAIVHVEACAPGTGILGTKATYEYEMSPSTLYTYSSVRIEEGQIDKDFAERTLKSDVKNAINEVLQANSIPLNDINPPVVTYTAPDVTITVGAQSCSTAPANTTIVSNGRIEYFCKDVNGTSTNQIFTTPFSVQITAISAIYQSQWEALASQVADKLRAKRNSEFYEEAIVTVS